MQKTNLQEFKILIKARTEATFPQQSEKQKTVHPKKSSTGNYGRKSNYPNFYG